MGALIESYNDGLEQIPDGTHLASSSSSSSHLEGSGVGQGLGKIVTGPPLNQVIKRRSMFNTGGEGLEVPEVAQRAQNGGGRVRDELAVSIKALLLNISLADPGRDQEGRDTTTKTVEREGVALAIGSGSSVGQVVRSGSQWWRDVVVETTSLIESDDEEGVLPLRRGTERFVDILQKKFTGGDQAAGVHGVGANTAARGVDIGELGQLTGSSIGVEVGKGLNVVVVAAVIGPVEEGGVRAGATKRVVVVLPGVASLVQLLEDGHLGVAVNALGEAIIVGAVAMGGTRDNEGTVRVGRLLERSVNPK